MNTARKHIVPHTSYMPNSRPVSITTLNRLATEFEIKRAMNGETLAIPIRVSMDMLDTLTPITLRAQYSRIEGAAYLPSERANFSSFIGSQPELQHNILSFNCVLTLNPHDSQRDKVGIIHGVPSSDCADADSPVWSHLLQPFGVANVPEDMMPLSVNYDYCVFGQPAVVTLDKSTGKITEIACYDRPITPAMKAHPLYQDDTVAMLYCYLHHGEILFFNAFFDLL